MGFFTSILGRISFPEYALSRLRNWAIPHPIGVRQRFRVAKDLMSPQQIGALIYWQQPGRRDQTESTKGFRMGWKKVASVPPDLEFRLLARE